jgi:hypothetical protein
MNRLIKALLLTCFTSTVSVFSSPNSANTSPLPIDLDRVTVTELSCYGLQTNGKVDCEFPENGFQKVEEVIWTGGSGFDVFFCNAREKYSVPQSNNGIYSGCDKQVVGGASGQSKVAYNRYGSFLFRFISRETATDIYINVHNDYQTSRFDFYKKAKPHY